MSTGYITVALSTAGEALPVKGAEVRIRNDVTGFFQRLLTDDTGKTQRLLVYAPARNLSLMPDADRLPYETYDIEVRSQGFEPVRIRGSQVFAGEDTLQQVSLVPLTRSALAEDEWENIVIPENTLRGDYTRWQGEGDPQRIQGEVFIPSKIKVHLGAPSSSAANISVNFADYIKNVASSEIYPTWPEEALKANILAQISLALNRIYTEHYPARGYDFDITSSPDYDQAYIRGRNIFDSISVIVDDIFNNYIRKKGFIEPFASTYCNGTTSKCDGMSQWGSKALADQGRSALSILKNYYGDVEITETNNIKAVTRSYPGSPLRRGSSGEDVLTIQRQLTAISKNYPSVVAIPALTGEFGDYTENAVKSFQKQFGLSADGVVGKSTWYKISYVYGAVRKLAELDSEGEALNIKPTPPTEVLRGGVKGDNVVLAQYLLNDIALYYPSIPEVSQDGVYGASTRDAVTAFQKRFGLGADGVVGASTWNKLFEVYSSIIDNVRVPEQDKEDVPGDTPVSCGIPPKADDPYPGTLRLGSQGASVRLLQQYLSYIALSLRRYNQQTGLKVIVPDGSFGSETENAVKLFQKRYGLSQDGVVGRNTWNKLISVYNAPCR